MSNLSWPELEYSKWKDTCQTVHLWTQIVGKIRLSLDPWANHSWYSTLYVTSRGLGTSAISNGTQNFSIDFDFVDHKLVILTSSGESSSFSLQGETVSSFYNRVMTILKELKIEAHFDPCPNEVQDATPLP